MMNVIEDPSLTQPLSKLAYSEQAFVLNLLDIPTNPAHNALHCLQTDRYRQCA